MKTTRIRKPDDDLVHYLEENTDIFTLKDIKNIHAMIAGHNDEDHWFWIIELNQPLEGGRFLLTNASCAYSGWDAQSGGSSKVASTKRRAALLAPEKEEYTGRTIRQNLLAQLNGTLAFGLEIVNP